MVNQTAKLVKISGTANSIGIQIKKNLIPLNGVWPLIDEKENFLNIIAVGDKNGLDEKINLPLLKKNFPTAKFIFCCRSGPYLINHYQEILNNFDAHMTLDFDSGNSQSLFMSHSMMARSLPYNGFFWPPSRQKKWDFSILTNIGDNLAKRWDRCLKLIDRLCGAGLTGLVVTQKGDFNRLPKRYFLASRSLRKLVAKNRLTLLNHLEPVKFHQLQAKAKVSIFPNSCDAFPQTIIENILADKPVIISQDLLIGKSVISPDFGPCLDFDDRQTLGRCQNLILAERKRKKPLKNRQHWLKRYSFLPLASAWAQELNRKFKTHCRLAFFLNHLDRVKKAKIKLAK